jgi:hypothetical protein
MKQRNHYPGSEDRTLYRVTIRESLDKEIAEWFGGFDVKVQENSTILEGRLIDQSELQGLLRKIHDLHLTLISVETIS